MGHAVQPIGKGIVQLQPDGEHDISPVEQPGVAVVHLIVMRPGGGAEALMAGRSPAPGRTKLYKGATVTTILGSPLSFAQGSLAVPQPPGNSRTGITRTSHHSRFMGAPLLFYFVIPFLGE